MHGFRKFLRFGFYIALVLVSITAVAGGALLFDFWLFLHLPGNPAPEFRKVTVQPGMNVDGIARLLYQELVISDPTRFHLLSLLRRSGRNLRAGEYMFHTMMTPDQVLEKLVQGKSVAYRVMFPEGSTVRDVAEILARNELASEEAILQAAGDQEFVRSLGLDAPGLEGYLFPETYHFKREHNARAILKAMVRQFRLHFPDAWRERAKELGLSVQEVVTLASIVEKEAMVDAERPTIAAVFLNRLKRNMLLQSDPTAVYDLPGFAGAITRSHLERESPYNTYRNPGLPPGPICNPGSRSLEAVLYPEDVPYLYFVSNNDGTHQFSTNLADHLQAVQRYREKRRLEAALKELSAEFGEDGVGKDDCTVELEEVNAVEPSLSDASTQGIEAEEN